MLVMHQSVLVRLRHTFTNCTAATSLACSMIKAKCLIKLSTLVDTDHQFSRCFSKKSMVSDLLMLPPLRLGGMDSPMVFNTRVWRQVKRCQALTKLSSQNAFMPCTVWSIPSIWCFMISTTLWERVASTGSTLWHMILYTSLVISPLCHSKLILYCFHKNFLRFCGGQS